MVGITFVSHGQLSKLVVSGKVLLDNPSGFVKMRFRCSSALAILSLPSGNDWFNAFSPEF